MRSNLLAKGNHEPDGRVASPRRPGWMAVRAGLLASAWLVAGCTLGGGGPEPFFARISGAEAVEAPLSGEALAQRKASMRRIRRDLSSFRKTLEQLQRHGKTRGIRRFEGFARPFIEIRVDPLISPSDPTTHPELRPFRAELLLSKAVLMDQMGDGRSVRATIERLQSEFAAMGSMLILYPTGEAVTLEQSIELLRTQTGAI